MDEGCLSLTLQDLTCFEETESANRLNEFAKLDSVGVIRVLGGKQTKSP